MSKTIRWLWVLVPVILIILICFAFPGYKKSQINRKWKRDRASLRTLAMALDAYSMNWSIYPRDLDTLTKKLVFDPPHRWKGGKIFSQMGPFIDEVPHSAFDKKIYPRYVSLDYRKPHHGSGRMWMTWFPGPDNDWDIEQTSQSEEMLQLDQNGSPPPSLLNKIYDPSNGALDGDIIRWKQ